MKTESFKHLKDYSYYNNLYDKFTVERCRRFEKYEEPRERKSTKNNKAKSKIKKKFTLKVVFPTALYFIKGDRYAKKAETIKEWMEGDKAHDQRIENTAAPKNILCPSCGSEMIIRMKDLQDDYRDKKKVLFFLNCPKCDKNKLIFEDGKNWECPPTLCKKCNSEMDKIDRKGERKIITTYKCPGCNYKEKDILDLDEKPEPKKIDPNFEKDCKRFCLSDEEGRKYVSQKERLEDFQKTLKDLTEKEENVFIMN